MGEDGQFIARERTGELRTEMLAGFLSRMKNMTRNKFPFQIPSNLRSPQVLSTVERCLKRDSILNAIIHSSSPPTFHRGEDGSNCLDLS